MAARRAPAERTGGAQHVGHGLIRRFALAPLGAALLPVAGQLLHDHSPNAYVPVGLTLATVILSVVTWNQAVTSRPRSDKARQALVIHSVTTTALTGVALVVICVSGFFGTVAWIYGMTAGTVTVSWMIRRLAIFDTAEDVKHGGGGLDAAADLSVKTAKVIEADKSTTKIKLTMAEGQSATTVRGRLDEIASSWPRRVIHGGATVKPGAYVGDAELTLRHADKLAKPPMWPGPDRAIIGQSICTGIVLGYYESGDLLKIFPAGNYGTPEAKAGNIIAAGNVGICGAPGSGKGVCTKILVANVAWFRDTYLIVVDPVKGVQFLNGIRPAVSAYADTPAKIKMVNAGIRRAIHDRADALGRYGFENWESAAFTHPELRMPAIVVLCEEFAQYALDNNSSFVSLAETARSTGIFMFFSAQSWKHDRIGTSMRTTVPNALCFGTVDDSAGYLLPDHVLDTGIDPQAWGSAFPGKLVVNANGIDPSHFAEPARTFNAQADDLLAVTEFFGPHMASLDPVTLAAFGDQFPYLDQRPPVIIKAPGIPFHLTPTFEESAEDLDTDDDPDDEEDGPMPTMSDYGVDPEMAEEANAINPRLEDTGDEWEGPDVDLSDPDDTTPEYSPERKQDEFRLALEALASAGIVELSFDEMRDAYVARVGENNAVKRWFFYEMVGNLREAGQLEMIGARGGRYRITMLVHQNGAVS